LAAGRGEGATPASRAKQASERSRPRRDQATISCAATIGPTPSSFEQRRRERAYVTEQFLLERVRFPGGCSLAALVLE
jgi:hypothetical protein